MARRSPLLRAGSNTSRWPRSLRATSISHRVEGASGMKLTLVVRNDAEAGRWSAVFPEVPGCASAGDTEQEAVANAKEAVALWFEPRDLELEEGARILEVAIP